jgi:hypothetical protein
MINDEQKLSAIGEVDRAGDSDLVPGMADVAEHRLRPSGALRYRLERRSSYCAETAWVWQRARFLCADPQ